jgi:anti-sigma B factor antagonist
MVDTTSAALKVMVRHSHRTIVVDVCGELDLSTADTLRDALLQVRFDRGVTVHVDLSRLDFLDSSGMGVLVAACRRVTAAGGAFAVCCDEGGVRRSLEIAGLREFLGLDQIPPGT